MEIWKNLLALNQLSKGDFVETVWTFNEGEFKIFSSSLGLQKEKFEAIILKDGDEGSLWLNNDDYTIYSFNGFKMYYVDTLEIDTLFLLKNYWSLVVSIRSNQGEFPFVLVHMASSLDGRVATQNGDSKWIGNSENLKHAHCLRALFDGIMVGSKTVLNDQPKLTVRHVEGPNPTRLILSNKCHQFNGLVKLNDTKTLLLRHEQFKSVKFDYAFDECIYFQGENDYQCLTNVLIQLKKLGIQSIMIEGGSQTVSKFIMEGLVDVFQIHIAPLVLGSGRSVVELPEISSIKEAKYLTNVRYAPMGDAIMITASL